MHPCVPTVYQPLVYEGADGVLSSVLVKKRAWGDGWGTGADNQACLSASVAELNLLPPLSSLKMRTLSARVLTGVS